MEQLLAQLIPMMAAALPFIKAAAKDGVDIDWAGIIKAESPVLLVLLEKVAQKFFPDMTPQQALIHVIVWAFLPKAYTPEMEKRFHDRGMLPVNKDTGDFPQIMN